MSTETKEIKLEEKVEVKDEYEIKLDISLAPRSHVVQTIKEDQIIIEAYEDQQVKDERPYWTVGHVRIWEFFGQYIHEKRKGDPILSRDDNILRDTYIKVSKDLYDLWTYLVVLTRVPYEWKEKYVKPMLEVAQKIRKVKPGDYVSPADYDFRRDFLRIGLDLVENSYRYIPPLAQVINLDLLRWLRDAFERQYKRIRMGQFFTADFYDKIVELSYYIYLFYKFIHSFSIIHSNIERDIIEQCMRSCKDLDQFVRCVFTKLLLKFKPKGKDIIEIYGKLLKRVYIRSFIFFPDVVIARKYALKEVEYHDYFSVKDSFKYMTRKRVIEQIKESIDVYDKLKTETYEVPPYPPSLRVTKESISTKDGVSTSTADLVERSVSESVEPSDTKIPLEISTYERTTREVREVIGLDDTKRVPTTGLPYIGYYRSLVTIFEIVDPLASEFRGYLDDETGIYYLPIAKTESIHPIDRYGSPSRPEEKVRTRDQIGFRLTIINRGRGALSELQYYPFIKVTELPTFSNVYEATSQLQYYHFYYETLPITQKNIAKEVNKLQFHKYVLKEYFERTEKDVKWFSIFRYYIPLIREYLEKFEQEVRRISEFQFTKFEYIEQIKTFLGYAKRISELQFRFYKVFEMLKILEDILRDFSAIQSYLP